MVESSCTVIGGYKELVNKCSRHYMTLCQFFAQCATLWKGCSVVQLYNVCPLSPCPPQVFLSMLSKWTTTTGLIPYQVQPGLAYQPQYPFGRQKPQEELQGQGDYGVWSIRGPYMCWMTPTPVHFQECLSMVIDWTLHLHHASFNQGAHCAEP